MSNAEGRVFLFLQGPHGPFFRQLAQALSTCGATVLRVAFNASDETEWRKAGALLRFAGDPTHFDEWLIQRIDAHSVTDVVVYGDTRPTHRTALEIARARSLTTHCFEEGYIRPSWITYERDGTNANSRVMSISLPRMAQALGAADEPDAELPATWGDYRQHLWHSALYHARCLVPNGRYGQFRGHRDESLLRECSWYWSRAAKAPWIWLWRSLRQWMLLRSDKTFHLVLLQLSFDASMQEHSDFDNTSEFVERVIDAFAEGAAPDEYLVLKAHPFEDGRERLGAVIRDVAQDLGVGKRVVFIDGGKKLAQLLDRARTAIMVNSTAAQQALWRGLPVAALGRAIYKKPGLASEQVLVSFLRHPRRPDLRSYWLFRQFLMETSQINGSFYAQPGIDRALATLPGIMLDPRDPYDVVLGEPDMGSLVKVAPSPTLIATG
ncbi:MAG: capsule biosynthesis protein CapA [Pseudomonadota bacterium]